MLDLRPHRIAAKQFRNDLNVKVQPLRLIQHLAREAAVPRGCQDDLVHKFRARNSAQISDSSDYPVAQRPLVIEQPAYFSAGT